MRFLDSEPKKFTVVKIIIHHPSSIVNVVWNRIQARLWHSDCGNQSKLWVFLVYVVGYNAKTTSIGGFASRNYSIF